MNDPNHPTPPNPPEPRDPRMSTTTAFSPEAVPTKPVGWQQTFRALGVRNFRLFYIGQGMSLVGTWMRRTAMGWLVFELTGRMDLLGAVMALSLAPLFILAPIAGAIADRMEKRRLIIYSQILAAIVSGTIAILVATDTIQVWHLMVLATIAGVAFSFEVPPRQAFVVELVGRDNLMNAIALNSGLVNLARVIGPALAGVLMNTVGMAWCFGMDSITYLIVIAMLLKLRLPRFEKKSSTVSRLEHLRGGLREVLVNRRVRVVLSLLFFVCVFGWSFNSLMPGIAQDYLKIDEKRYGILMAMFGVGATVGALFVASRTEHANRRMQLFAGVGAMVVGLGWVSFMHSFAGFIIPLLIAGWGAVTFISTANTVVQISVADEIRGRVMGIWALTFGGSMPIGSLIAGFVAEWLDPFITVKMFVVILGGAALLIYRRLPPRHSAAGP
ncbi:MFS transporter [bacterium]|nr:MFS transporter [bacterium]